MKRISNVWSEPPPDDHLHLYVTVPGKGSPALSTGNAGSPRALQLGGCFIRLFALDQDLTNPLLEGEAVNYREYEDIFIEVKQWGAFEGSDIEENGLRSYGDGTVPDFVVEFERKLDGKPSLAADVCCFLDHSSDADGSM
jgi:hypothetical protein